MNVSLKWTLVAGVFFLSLPLTASAFGRDKAGNGGGSHVCRDLRTGAIRSIEMYDRYEARARYGLSPLRLTGASEAEIFDSAMKRLATEAKSLAIRARAMREVVLAKFVFRTGKLLPTVDSDRMLVDAGCAYEQVAVWDERTGKIFVDRLLYDALSEYDRAALIAHEAIYKLARIYSKATDSDETRLVIGKIFSDTRPRTGIDGRYSKRFQTPGITLYDENSPLIVNHGEFPENRKLSLRIGWSRPDCYDYLSLPPTEAENDDELPLPFPVVRSELAFDQKITLTFDRYWLKVLREREEWDRRFRLKDEDLLLGGAAYPAEPMGGGKNYGLSYGVPLSLFAQNFSLASRVETSLDPNIEAQVRIDVTNPRCSETVSTSVKLRANTRVTIEVLQ